MATEKDLKVGVRVDATATGLDQIERTRAGVEGVGAAAGHASDRAAEFGDAAAQGAEQAGGAFGRLRARINGAGEQIARIAAATAALGVVMPIDVERRIDGAAGIGAHKTSMLQDFERGRPIELDAIVGAVAELGRIVGVPCPMIDAIFALTRQKASLAGLYPH